MTPQGMVEDDAYESGVSGHSSPNDMRMSMFSKVGIRRATELPKFKSFGVEMKELNKTGAFGGLDVESKKVSIKQDSNRG